MSSFRINDILNSCPGEDQQDNSNIGSQQANMQAIAPNQMPDALIEQIALLVREETEVDPDYHSISRATTSNGPLIVIPEIPITTHVTTAQTNVRTGM